MAKRKTLPQYAMPNDTPITSPLRAGLATIPGSLMDALQTYERMALATRPGYTSEADLARAQQTPEERVQQIRMDAYVLHIAGSHLQGVNRRIFEREILRRERCN